MNWPHPVVVLCFVYIQFSIQNIHFSNNLLLNAYFWSHSVRNMAPRVDFKKTHIILYLNLSKKLWAKFKHIYTLLTLHILYIVFIFYSIIKCVHKINYGQSHFIFISLNESNATFGVVKLAIIDKLWVYNMMVWMAQESKKMQKKINTQDNTQYELLYYTLNRSKGSVKKAI